MRLPTGAIDQTFNLVHKGCGIVLMVLAIAFGFSAHHRIFGKDGTADKIEQTMQHLSDSANSTHDLIAGESERQKALYDKLGAAVDQAGGTIKAANSTITKLGNAIDTTQANLTATTGAVNGTLGEVQTSLSTFRNDLHGTMGKVDASLDQLPPLFIQARTSLKAIDGITASMLPIAQNVAGITGSGKHIMETVDGKVTELAKPKSTLRKAWDRFLDAAHLANALKFLFGL